jgi:hypothetical protein
VNLIVSSSAENSQAGKRKLPVPLAADFSHDHFSAGGLTNGLSGT